MKINEFIKNDLIVTFILNIKIHIMTDIEYTKEELNKICKEKFGHKMKTTQRKIIRRILKNKDTMVILPTGYGKSLIYQFVHVITQKYVIVISPLISLMHDQKTKLDKLHIDTYIINSNINEQEVIFKKIKKKPCIIYTTPESLHENKLEKFLYSIKSNENIALIAVDEAHCVHDWGTTFRTEYSDLGNRIKKITDCITKYDFDVESEEVRSTPILALSATASSETRISIMKSLKMKKETKIMIGNLSKTNIHIKVRDKPKINDFIKFVKDNVSPQESTIIYCVYINEVEKIKDLLLTEGLKVCHYHSKLSKDIKNKNQNDFMNSKCNLIVSTKGLGMGIDKKDIRKIIHYGSPDSISEYYQHIGRAGRDSKKSECILFAAFNDLRIYRISANKNTAYRDNKELLKKKITKIKNMSHFIFDGKCRMQNILKNFDIDNSPPCGNCDVCTEGTLELKCGKELRILSDIVINGQLKFGSKKMADIISGMSNKAAIRFKDSEFYGKSKVISKWWKNFIPYCESINIIDTECFSKMTTFIENSNTHKYLKVEDNYTLKIPKNVSYLLSGFKKRN